jgi:hypothetical protein
VSTVLRTAALCGLVAVGARPEVAIAIAGVLSAASAVAVRPRVRGVPVEDDGTPRWLGTSLAVSSLAVSALQGIDKVLLPLVTNAHDAGRYAAMSNLSTYSLGALFSIVSATVFAPMLRLWDGGEHGAALHRLRSASMAALGSSVFVASVLLLSGRAALNAIVGEDYVDPRVLAALLIETGLMTSGQFAVYLYQFRLHTRALQARSWAAALLTTSFVVVGGRLGGSSGAAAAMVAGLAVYALLLQFRSGTGAASAIATALVATLGTAAALGADPVAVGAVGIVVGGWLLASVLWRPVRRLACSFMSSTAGAGAE